MQTCPVCENDFEIKYKWRSQKYCTKQCWSVRGDRHKKTCIGCGKVGLGKWGKKYCSRECSQKQTDENANGWKGGNVGYSGVHKYIVSRYGKPKKCFNCDGDQPRVEWANVSGEYSRKRRDWIELCSSCHRYFDRNKTWNSVILSRWEQYSGKEARLDG